MLKRGYEPESSEIRPSEPIPLFMLVLSGTIAIEDALITEGTEQRPTAI